MYSTAIHDFIHGLIINKIFGFSSGCLPATQSFCSSYLYNIFLKIITMYLIVLLGNSSKKKVKCEIPEEDEMKKEVDNKADAEVHKDDEKDDEIEILPRKLIITNEYIFQNVYLYQINV